jgi:hypothetical protein
MFMNCYVQIKESGAELSSFVVARPRGGTLCNVAELNPDLVQVRRSKLGTGPPRPRVKWS